jgi:KDO2-lipid IV(A) lauroyltransferase
MRVKEYLEYLALYVGMQLSRVIPKRALYALSGYIVKRSYRDNERRRERVAKHLELAFPERGEEERAEIFEAFLTHLSSFYVEILLISTGRLDFDTAVVNEEEVLGRIERLVRRDGRGLILLVSHYGNWEFLGHWLAYRGLSGAVVAREFKNTIIDERLIVPFRERYGNSSIERKGAIVSIVRLLKAGGGVALLIDQMIPPPNGIDIEFFGRKAYALKSAAQLKLKLDPLVVPVFAERVGRESFRIHIEEPVEYCVANLDGEEKVRALTQRYSDILQERIERNPAQWQWAYRRWRLPKHDSRKGERKVAAE